MPKVSVLMPTYESNPDYLTTAIESVLAQTEKDWELIIHDDCSTKDVHAIVVPYLSDSRIFFARSPTRLGIGGNWNACLRLSHASIVQYLFQDDVWAPNALADGLAAIEKFPSAGMISLCYEYKVEAGADTKALYDAVTAEKNQFLTPGLHSGKEFLSQWVARGLHPCIPGEPCFVMLRRSVMEKAGEFLTDMPQLLDCEYWSRMLLAGDWAVVPGNHGYFRVHGESTSMRNFREGIGLFDRLRTLEGIRPKLQAPARRQLDRVLSDQLARMIKKFLERKKSGGGVSAKGGGAVKSFVLRHPVITAKAMIKALRS